MSTRSSRSSALVGALLFAPYAALLLFCGVVPLGIAFVASLQPSGLNPAGGFSNYVRIFEDFRFLPALTNVGMFLLIYVPVMLVAVVALSLMLDSIQRRWALPLRLAYIMPASLSGAVSVLVWYILLEPTLSPYAPALHALGLTRSDQIWSTGNLAVIFVLMAFFTGAGNWIVVQYGSLQSIPDEILDAAKIDGASQLQIGLQIKLPLIRKYVIYMAILTFAAGMQVFVEPQLISASVFPGLAKDWSLNQLSYTFAFTGQLGQAAALSLMLLVVCVIGALVLIFRTRFFDRGEDRS